MSTKSTRAIVRTDLNRLDGTDKNDHLNGGTGNNRLNGGDGNNILTGGKGKNTFILHQGQGFDTVKDFKIGEDHMKLGAGIGFQNLTLTQRGRDMLISSGSDQLAVLKGIRTDQITASDFTR
jgi:Ca2+-binding RTX toxin-like protein